MQSLQVTMWKRDQLSTGGMVPASKGLFERTGIAVAAPAASSKSALLV